MAATKLYDLRLAALRDSLVLQRLDGWFVGREDMYQGEEVQAGDERLAFLCGFTGSAGFGVVLKHNAAQFSDGRYSGAGGFYCIGLLDRDGGANVFHAVKLWAIE